MTPPCGAPFGPRWSLTVGPLELPLLASMGRVLAVVMTVYLWIRFLDMSHRHVFGLLAQNRVETWLFALEIALTVIPTVLLYQAATGVNPS